MGQSEVDELFRYTAEGKLIEEWMEYDNVKVLKELGVDLVAVYKAQP